MAVRLTLRRLNRATLARQMLLARRPLPVVDAARRLVALQAQEPASPYLALWNRVADLDARELDEAFRSFALVKATLLRITLHAVAADDRAPFRAAMRPTLRAAGLHDARYRSTGLSVADGDALVPHVVAIAQRPRSRQEIEAALAERLGAPIEPGVWRALRMIAPLVHAPSEASWSFGRSPRYVAAPELVGDEEPAARHDAAERDDPAPATVRLVRRYLEAFGPASRQDVAQFALLPQAEVAPAFAAASDDLVSLPGPDGATLYDVLDAPIPDEDVPAPVRLLGMWDSVLLAYKDRGRILPRAYRSHVIRRNGDVLPTVLVDGFVAGVWRHVDGCVEVTAFHALPDDAWDGIEREARALSRFVAERDGGVYGRFGHWWSRLPKGRVRTVRPG